MSRVSICPVSYAMGQCGGGAFRVEDATRLFRMLYTPARIALVAAIRDQVAAVAARRSLDLEWVDLPSFAETTCDPALSRALEVAIEAEGIEPMRIFSGAGHDAIAMSRVAPVSMLFVRCRDGISHNPLESIVVKDVEVALRVLDRFLRAIGEGEG